MERLNCSTRQFVKPFTRLTLAYCKKLRNLSAAVSLFIAWYNFCWRSRENGKSGRKRLTLAMRASVVGTLWKIDDLYGAVIA